jgi:hypothetical protein
MLLLEIKTKKIKETTCFGLILAIIRFHLEKLFCESVIQLFKRALVLSSNHLRVWLYIAYKRYQQKPQIHKQNIAYKLIRNLKMGPTGCSETSLTNYQSTLLKIPE